MRRDLAGFEIGLLAPRHPAAHKHIRRPGKTGPFIGRAVNARRAAVLPSRPDHQRVPAHCHRDAELVILRDLRSLQVSLLAPRHAAAHKDISRPGKVGPLIGRAIDARRAAGLIWCPNDYRVPAYRHRKAEALTTRDLGGLQVGLLAPHCPTSHKHIGRSGTAEQLIRHAVDPCRAAVLQKRPDHHRIPAHGHRGAEPIIPPGVT